VIEKVIKGSLSCLADSHVRTGECYVYDVSVRVRVRFRFRDRGRDKYRDMLRDTIRDWILG
jgi:hypothetical protein